MDVVLYFPSIRLVYVSPANQPVNDNTDRGKSLLRYCCRTARMFIYKCIYFTYIRKRYAYTRTHAHAQSQPEGTYVNSRYGMRYFGERKFEIEDLKTTLLLLLWKRHNWDKNTWLIHFIPSDRFTHAYIYFLLFFKYILTRRITTCFCI